MAIFSILLIVSFEYPEIVGSGTLTADRVVSIQRSTQGADRTEKLIEIDDLVTRTAQAGSENRGTGKRI